MLDAFFMHFNMLDEVVHAFHLALVLKRQLISFCQASLILEFNLLDVSSQEISNLLDAAAAILVAGLEGAAVQALKHAAVDLVIELDQLPLEGPVEVGQAPAHPVLHESVAPGLDLDHLWAEGQRVQVLLLLGRGYRQELVDSALIVPEQLLHIKSVSPQLCLEIPQELVLVEDPAAALQAAQFVGQREQLLAQWPLRPTILSHRLEPDLLDTGEHPLPLAILLMLPDPVLARGVPLRQQVMHQFGLELQHDLFCHLHHRPAPCSLPRQTQLRQAQSRPGVGVRVLRVF
jgi:hypothetical protein